MKIGDLFISLGFKVEGKDKLDDADRSMRTATLKAGALAIAINAINYAFLRMVDAGRQAAVEFKNFAAATGLSADELKRWQQAAEINDVSGAEIADTVKNLQKETAEIRLGRGNIAPFQLLGISPTQDPFAILRDLRARIRELPPEMARVIAGQMGISDNVFQMLRAANLELDRLDEKYRMTEKEQADLIELNRAWKDLLFSIKAVRDKFAADFAPMLTVITRGLKLLTEGVASFVQWLGKGSAGARVARTALFALVALMFTLGAALAAVAASLAVISGILAAMNLAAFPALVAFGKLAAVVGFIVAGIGILILLIQDFWTQIEGGKSFFDWNENLILTVKNVERLAAAFEKILNLYERIQGLPSAVRMLLFPQTEIGRVLSEKFGGGGGNAINQQNNVRVMVDGSRSPEETAKAVASEVQGVMSEAAYQTPIYNF